jgi:competence protein ComEC
MGEALLPLAASACWAGLVVGAASPEWMAPSALLAAGAAAMAGALLAAPREGWASSTLERSGILDPDARLQSVAPRVARGGLAGACPAALALLSVALLAAGWGLSRDRRLDASALATIAPDHVVAVGSVRQEPQPGTYGWSAVVDVSIVEASSGTMAVDETALVEGAGDRPPAARADRVVVEGLAEAPTEGEFATSLRRRGIAVVVTASSFERLGGSTDLLTRAAQATRSFVGRSVRRLLPAREAGLVLGLALGDGSHLDPEVERDFRAAGLGHLLVASGENVAMVLAPVLALATLLRVPPGARLLAGLATVSFFVLVTGAEPSVLRAAAMAGLALAGVFGGRPRSTPSVLGAVVLVLLLLDPSLVWSIAFQLSVAATAAMIALSAPLAARLHPLPRPIALAAGATIAAQAGVSPLLLYHFHEVPGSTLVANVVAFPLVEPALLLGISAAVMGVVWLPGGRLLAALARVPLGALEALADRLARAPVPWVTSGGGIGALIVGGAALAAVLWRMRSGRRVPRPALAVAVLVGTTVLWASALSSGPPSGLRVVFFDVGQGDAALVRSPAGATVLVDGGPDPDAVATKLTSLGVRRLDVVVASHPHADHIVGLPAVLSRFPVALALEPGCRDASALYRNLLTAFADEDVPVRHPRAGDSYRVADVRLDILSPAACYSGTESDANNDAIVFLLTYREDSVLFATEPEEPAQQAMLDAGLVPRADVLKVPHHGAATSLPGFFDAVDADLAVVSVGPNPYGHPVPAVLARIQATGARVLRTDRLGDITVTFDGPGIRVDSAA